MTDNRIKKNLIDGVQTMIDYSTPSMRSNGALAKAIVAALYPQETPQVEISPDELLTDSQIIHDALEVLHTEKEGYLLIAKAIRADEKIKCHQSEAAEIASLKADIEELTMLNQSNEAAEIKDLEVKLKQQAERINELVVERQSLLKANQDHQKQIEDLKHQLQRGCVDCEDAIRADERKKIGKELRLQLQML